GFALQKLHETFKSLGPFYQKLPLIRMGCPLPFTPQNQQDYYLDKEEPKYQTSRKFL
ncbi:hypothetical protein J6590_099705, partial [Homalodisca vitripennis]